MAEHIDIVLSITGALFMFITGIIAWQGNRQIRRIDKLEDRMVEIEENTNKAVNNMKDNYVKQFREVRQDISDLKELNAINFGDIKCELAKLTTKLKMNEE